jgi:hypothetical protein
MTWSRGVLYGKIAPRFLHVVSSRFEKWGSNIASGRARTGIKTRGLITR